MAKPKLTNQKLGSVAFYLAIPLSYFLSFLFVVSIIKIFLVADLSLISKGTGGVFFISFIAGIISARSFKMPKFRTWLHEMKHAVMVVLTGQRLKEIHVETHTGHVMYEGTVEHLRYGPLVILAPYYFPFFSLPLFGLLLFFEPIDRRFSAALLGFFLALDMATSYMEIDPIQSDLQRIWGGIFVAKFFVLGIQLLFLTTALLWVIAGGIGLLFPLNEVARYIYSLLKFTLGVPQ
jgi:hypothetical protein